jgi:hypothetical protein
MVQATSPVQDSGQDGTQHGFRVGTSHDAPSVTGAAQAPADRPKLPPIEWAHTDHGKIMREDLLGVGEATGTMVLTMAALIGTTVAIAFAITAVLGFLGVDVTSMYNG